MSDDESASGLTQKEKADLIEGLCGDVLEMFRDNLPYDDSLYFLHEEILVAAISNASSDLGRTATYHSTTGASIYRKAGFVGWWISHHRPVQLTRRAEINLQEDAPARSLLGINAVFAALAVNAMLGSKNMPTKLVGDLKYLFQFRPRADGDAVAMLLENTMTNC